MASATVAIILAVGHLASILSQAEAAERMPGGAKVAGYLAAWSVIDEGFAIADIPADQLTHVIYAFGGVGQDGTADLGDPCLDVGDCPAEWMPVGPGGNFAQLSALKERHPHLKVSISLGGWAGSTYFSNAAESQEARQRFVGSTIDVFIRPFPDLFDGIDIDWEFPVEGGKPGNIYRSEDKENLSLLMEEFRHQLNALDDGKRYELSVAVTANPAYLENIEAERLGRMADWVNVMTYDYHAGSGLAHFNAPLFATSDDPTSDLNVHTSVELYLSAGVPPQKLVIGIPFYGRSYGDVADENQGLFQAADPDAAGDWGAHGIDYRELLDRQPEAHGFERFWHDEAQVPWLYNRAARLWVSYDDPRSVERKAAYARERRLGGVMIWHIGADNGDLLAALLGGLSD